MKEENFGRNCLKNGKNKKLTISKLAFVREDLGKSGEVLY